MPCGRRRSGRNKRMRFWVVMALISRMREALPQKTQKKTSVFSGVKQYSGGNKTTGELQAFEHHRTSCI